MNRRLVIAFAVAASGVMMGAALAASGNGRAGVTPAYYDAALFNINFTELPPGAESAILEHNKNFNIIYTSEDTTLPNGDMFISVLDAIQGDGFNPLWREVEITFNVTPFQLFSDDEVLAAAQAGQISLHVTDEVYRCSVISPKIKS
ncbi:MAG: hypothetical protein ACM3VT_16265 [Solirubrobacterales bacterium]